MAIASVIDYVMGRAITNGHGMRRIRCFRFLTVASLESGHE
jgi:hypothetical protein